MTEHESDLATTTSADKVKDHFREMRKIYPLTVYAEEHWEIYDEVEARIVAVFYNEDEAVAYIEWQNEKAQEDD